MENDDDIELNADDLEALKGVAANVKPEPSVAVNLSKKALDHGLVTRDENGVLQITVKGTRLLRRPS